VSCGQRRIRSLRGRGEGTQASPLDRSVLVAIAVVIAVAIPIAFAAAAFE
jgi:hypothetical protein